MIVSPENLQRHIKLIRSLGVVPMHLDEWLRKKKAGKALPKLAVAFTFDDGWRDNYIHGYPVLRKENVPATIFLVTGMINTKQTFWPERVIELLRTPGTNLNDPKHAWLKAYLGNFSNKATPLSLLEADEVINRLKELDDNAIIQHLKNSVLPVDSQDRQTHKRPAILQSSDLVEMSRDKLIKYGAHSRNHFRLNRLQDEQILKDEIKGSLDDIMSLGNAGIPVFCYPNGNITDEAEALVSHHYEAACTTKTGWNLAGCNPLDLHRFNLHDGNSHNKRTLLATIGRGLL